LDDDADSLGDRDSHGLPAIPDAYAADTADDAARTGSNSAWRICRHAWNLTFPGTFRVA